jgi:predicted TIM-barrel fold metal-dependent hydrolase
MDPTNALTELEALAEKLELQVVYDHFTGEGMSTGGLCKVKGAWRVIIERRASPSEKISILARALSRFDLEQHFVSPAVRELIEQVAARTEE